MTIIKGLVEQHAEELSPLHNRRRSLTGAPHVTLSDLLRLDEHMAAHIDGLLAAEEAAWLDEGQTLKELLEFARLMLQTRRVPYLPDWDITDDLMEELGIPLIRATP